MISFFYRLNILTGASVKGFFKWGVLILLAFAVLYRLVVAFSYKLELLNGETNNVWNALKTANGGALYGDPGELPFEIFQYTPLSQVPVIIAARMFDDGEADYVYKVVAFGRSCSLLFNCIAIGLLVLAFNGFGRSNGKADFWWYSLAGVVGFSTLTHVSFGIRPDAMALMFMAFTVFSFTRWLSGRPAHLFLSVTFLILGFLSKQDAILISIPIGFYMLILGDFKRFSIYTSVSMLFLLIGIYVSSIILGEFFIFSVFNGVRNPLSFHHALYVMDRFFNFYGFQVVGFAGVLSFLLYDRVKLRKPFSNEILLMLILSSHFLIQGVVTSFKMGSGFSYYTPFIIFSVFLMIRSAADRLRGALPSVTFQVVSLSIAVCLSCLFIFRQFYVYTSPYFKYCDNKESYFAHYQCINNLSLQIGLDDMVFASNPVARIFLHRSSIMPNTEFYGVSPVDYSQFSGERPDYLVVGDGEVGHVNNVMDFFKVDMRLFEQVSRCGSYTLLKRTTSLHEDSESFSLDVMYPQ